LASVFQPGEFALSQSVAVTIVTFNSDRYIAGCLEHVLAQNYTPFEVVVVDNASTDSTVAILNTFENRPGIRSFYNRLNVGFAAAQNQAIAAASNADWILTLNPDVRLTPNFLAALLSAGETDPDIGSMCGKLLAAAPDFEVTTPPLLDSSGIYFTRSLRHLDRGNRVRDQGQYDSPEFVFGGTGAACLYRKAMIRDLQIFGEFFDTDFFAYREDADVAWRAQLLGWKCLYTPAAVGLHVRTVLAQERRAVPPNINLHSVKNRWLLRIKNITPDLYRRCWFPITLRDMVVIGGCLLHEWSSLPAFSMVIKLWPRAWRKRREIMKRKRAGDASICSWFSDRPTSYPIDPAR
jgi:GT2 family glycosyltransferase